MGIIGKYDKAENEFIVGICMDAKSTRMGNYGKLWEKITGIFWWNDEDPDFKINGVDIFQGYVWSFWGMSWCPVISRQIHGSNSGRYEQWQD